MIRLIGSRSDRSRRSLWLRFCLVFALVPVLVVSSGAAGNAAASVAAGEVTHGPRVDALIEWGDQESKLGAATGQWFSCRAPMFWSVASSGVQIVQAENVACASGYAAGNEWDIQLTWRGQKEGGGTCLGTSGMRDEVPLHDGWGIGATMSDTPCVIDQVCWVMSIDRDFWTDGGSASGCQSIAIGGPSSQSLECVSGTFSRPTLRPRDIYVGSGSNNNRYRSVADFTIDPKAPTESTSRWQLYVVGRETPTNASPDWTEVSSANTDIGPIVFRYMTEAGNTWSAAALTLLLSGAYPAGSIVQNVEVIGVGIAKSSASVSTWGRTLRQGTSGRLGVTDPGTCAFYWGEKIVDDPASLFDDPAGVGPVMGEPADTGGTPEPPDTTGPPVSGDPMSCDFSFRDPSTWATAGLCQLVKLIGALLGLVRDMISILGGLVDGILSGLVSILSWLFTPSEGVLEDANESIMEEFEDGPSGEWSLAATQGIQGALPSGGASSARSAVGGAAARGGVGLPFGAASGGCAGPGFTWDKFAMIDLPTTLHPFDACSGVTADLAYWTRMILMAGIGIGTLLKVMQMLMVAIGIQKQVNALGFDWSEGSSTVRYPAGRE